MSIAAAPSPELLFQTLNAYQRTAALKTAIELDVLSAIHEGAQTAPALAERLGTSTRGIRILCDFLVVSGLITKAGDRYALTPDTAYSSCASRRPTWVGRSHSSGWTRS